MPIPNAKTAEKMTKNIIIIFTKILQFVPSPNSPSSPLTSLPLTFLIITTLLIILIAKIPHFNTDINQQKLNANHKKRLDKQIGRIASTEPKKYPHDIGHYQYPADID